MSSTAIRTALSFLGRWLAIATLVAFLTFTFSFLGTILCAVVIGMMMGGTRHARWLTLPVALIFPAVVFAMLRSSQTELLQTQINGVSLLCFGAFWLSYLMTWGVMAAEKKQTTAAQPVARGSDLMPPSSAICPGPTTSEHCPCAGPTVRVVDLTLEILEGLWGRETKETEPADGKTRLEITRDHLVIKSLDTEGHVRWIAEGDLRLEQKRGETRFVLSEEGCPSRAFSKSEL